MLSSSDSRRLTVSYSQYLSNPNIVSISYCETRKSMTDGNVLCFGVVKKLKCEDIVKPNKILPKSVLFETENKVKIEMQLKWLKKEKLLL